MKIINHLIKIIVLTLSLSSCAPQKNIHGMMISSIDIDNIVIGETNIDYFIDKYGEPSFTGAFNSNVYYKHEITNLLPASKKDFIERTILALELDDNGIIISKSILNLSDAYEINPASGKTTTAGSDFTFLQQVFSNLRSGRFSSEE
tara:strand:+ start:23 stop:463 length:441 start_codon:yes stop_codon:yes gene_type:complete